MIATYAIIGLALAWMFWELRFWLRDGLIIGKTETKYARYQVCNALRNHKAAFKIQGGNLPEGQSPNGEPLYDIVLSPGVDNVLCGWDWLNQHCADMVDYQPHVTMNIAGVRYNMTVKQPAILKDVMKANKLTKRELATIRN